MTGLTDPLSLSLRTWIGLLPLENVNTNVTTDHHTATIRRNDEVAEASVGTGGPTGPRQATLADLADDGTYQTTLAGHARDRSAGKSTDRTRINAFPMREVVLVSHYFESEAAFSVLEPYYDRGNYRFEIPREAFRAVRDELLAHGYDLELVGEIADYAVVVRKYSRHPETIREDSVVKFSNDDFNVFVMPDESAVKDAVYGGAVRLAEAPVTVRFPTRHTFER